MTYTTHLPPTLPCLQQNTRSAGSSPYDASGKKKVTSYPYGDPKPSKGTK